MKNNKQFKLYISPGHYHTVRMDIHHGMPKTPKPRNKKRFAKRTMGALARSAYLVCYGTGLGLLYSAQAVYAAAKKETRKTKDRFFEYGSLLKQRQFVASLAVFFIMLMGASLLFKGARLVALGVELKGRVLGAATIGSQQLTDAQQLVQQKNIEGAQTQFYAAYRSFESSKEQFGQTNQILSGLINLLPQKRDADALLTSAQLVSKSGATMLDFYQHVGTITFSPQGIQSDIPLPELLSQGLSSLHSSLADIRKANQLMSGVDESLLPASYQSKVKDAKEKLALLERSLGNMEDMVSMFEHMVVGKKKLLFVFENNNELRATGGFIGTYGDADIVDGKIEKLKVSSVYDLDGQLREKILPPAPMLNVNDRWYLRDSNWFADFSESAKKISGFYEKEGGETPDMVIAMTPNLITDLLRLTGPITMSGYNVTLNAENFVEATQVSTSVEYEKQLNAPKQLLADFIPTLLQKLMELDTQAKEQAIGLIQKNLNGKHIVFYSRDKELESKFISYNWAGTLADTDRDYLSIVTSNLGGTKSDLAITQKVKLQSSIAEDGHIINRLTITRTNTMPHMDKAENDSFMRIYVPLGSTLLSNTGFDINNLETVNAKDFKTDPDVRDWEKNAVKDVTTGTLIGKESGKTYFGNWVNLVGGETRTLELTYQLPFKLSQLDHHTLLLQKQIGTLPMDMSYSISFPGRSSLWVNASTDKLETNSWTIENSLDKDYLYGIVLKK